MDLSKLLVVTDRQESIVQTLHCITALGAFTRKRRNGTMWASAFPDAAASKLLFLSQTQKDPRSFAQLPSVPYAHVAEAATIAALSYPTKSIVLRQRSVTARSSTRNSQKHCLSTGVHFVDDRGELRNSPWSRQRTSSTELK